MKQIIFPIILLSIFLLGCNRETTPEESKTNSGSIVEKEKSVEDDKWLMDLIQFCEDQAGPEHKKWEDYQLKKIRLLQEFGYSSEIKASLDKVAQFIGEFYASEIKYLAQYEYAEETIREISISYNRIGDTESALEILREWESVLERIGFEGADDGDWRAYLKLKCELSFWKASLGLYEEAAEDARFVAENDMGLFMFMWTGDASFGDTIKKFDDVGMRDFVDWLIQILNEASTNSELSKYQRAVCHRHLALIFIMRDQLSLSFSELSKSVEAIQNFGLFLDVYTESLHAVRTAQLFLRAGGISEADSIIHEFEKHFHRVNKPSSRCNVLKLLVKYYREKGDTVRANALLDESLGLDYFSSWQIWEAYHLGRLEQDISNIVNPVIGEWNSDYCIIAILDVIASEKLRSSSLLEGMKLAKAP